MSTKISTDPANTGAATVVNLPDSTKVKISAVTNSSKTQGVFFQFEFNTSSTVGGQTPADFGYTGSGENNTALVPATHIKTGTSDQGGGTVQVYLWSVSNGQNQGSKVTQSSTSTSITLSTEDATDGDNNDTILTFSW